MANEHYIEENIRNCATSLMLEQPDLERGAAEKAVRECAMLPSIDWMPWSGRAPTKQDAPIIGRDCLGYVHMATHLIGSNGQWCDHWLPVRDHGQTASTKQED